MVRAKAARQHFPLQAPPAVIRKDVGAPSTNRFRCVPVLNDSRSGVEIKPNVEVRGATLRELIPLRSDVISIRPVIILGHPPKPTSYVFFGCPAPNYMAGHPTARSVLGSAPGPSLARLR